MCGRHTRLLLCGKAFSFSPMSVVRLIAAVLVPLLTVMILSGKPCYATDDHLCSSSCGNIPKIASPFRLETDPLHCGDLRYNLSCENNVTVLYFYPDEMAPRLDELPKRYVVQAINYDNYTIRVVDPGVEGKNCSSIPINTLSKSSEFFLDWNPYLYEPEIRYGFLKQASLSGFPKATFKNSTTLSQTIIFFTCEKPVNSSGYIESPCIFKGSCSSGNSSLARAGRRSYYYVLDGALSTFSDLEESCCVEQMSLITKRDTTYKNADDIHNALVQGFELSWVQSFDKTGVRLCYVHDRDPKKVSCLSGCSFIDYRVSFGCSKCIAD